MDGRGTRQPGRDAAGVQSSAIVFMLTAALAVFGFGAYLAGANQATPDADQAACPTGTPSASPEAAGAMTADASPEATPAAELCVEVGSYDIHFEPNVITIPADTPVEFVLPNHGAALHNFSIDEHNNPDVPNLGISVDIEPGDAQSVTIEAPAGTYYFYCNVPGHEAAGMFGYVIVEEGAEISAETETVTPPSGG